MLSAFCHSYGLAGTILPVREHHRPGDDARRDLRFPQEAREGPDAAWKCLATDARRRATSGPPTAWPGSCSDASVGGGQSTSSTSAPRRRSPPARSPTKVVAACGGKARIEMTGGERGWVGDIPRQLLSTKKIRAARLGPAPELGPKRSTRRSRPSGASSARTDARPRNALLGPDRLGHPHRIPGPAGRADPRQPARPEPPARRRSSSTMAGATTWCAPLPSGIGPRPRVRHLDAPGNIPESRNVALGVARGELVAFLDADEVAPPSGSRPSSPPFADPEVGFAGGPTPGSPGDGDHHRGPVLRRLPPPILRPGRPYAGARPSDGELGLEAAALPRGRHPRHQPLPTRRERGPGHCGARSGGRVEGRLCTRGLGAPRFLRALHPDAAAQAAGLRGGRVRRLAAPREHVRGVRHPGGAVRARPAPPAGRSDPNGDPVHPHRGRMGAPRRSAPPGRPCARPDGAGPLREPEPTRD